MADTESDIIFQSAVEHQNQPHFLTLSKYQLSWDSSSRTRSFDSQLLEPLVRHDSSIDLREVIGIKPIKIPPKPSTLILKKSFKVNENAGLCFEMQALGPVGFSVYYVTQPGNHKWRYDAIAFQCKDSSLCQQWINSIREALKNSDFQRPQNLVVFVNPTSGKRKAVRVYSEKVLPLLELADVKVRLIETQRQNHARDLVQETLDLDTIDGLVVVGGDGMFSEVLNGLLKRSAQESQCEEVGNFQPVPPNIRVGIIPAGSTNTIVFSTTGCSDPVTSALQIILGSRLGIDVNSIMVNERLDRYCVTLVGYGYMGDLLKDSENKRWMGPKRYDWSGTKKFLSNNAYYGEVKFRLTSNQGSNPADQVKCYTGCDTCFGAKEDLENGQHKPADSDSSDIPKEQWKTVMGKFAAVNGVTMTCSCDLSPQGMSPFCHLGDGCMDLILVTECSRIDFLKFLLRTAKGEERQSLNFVETYRVKEFSFRSMTEETDVDRLMDGSHISHSKRVKLKRQMAKTSVWNCDGEVVSSPELTVRTHCQLVELFAKGIADPSLSLEDQRCKTCCSLHSGSM